ncbi:aminofutalosine synthase MqnE [Syntrophobotulus glycolicus]|uniref:aminofutalosine synthase MqnE n=1 Tax=Syntrophobotulus glycolicus TaxID=51197 RepID=UPI00059C23AB|nr:aminofutalosine synthase MqnE [Syntrophobotulus glycolicus]
MNNLLQQIEKKVFAGQRLTKEEGLALMECKDLLFLGRLAREIKLRHSGRKIFFNVNFHINLTNICVSECRFCAFGVRKESGKAYFMTLEDILQKIAKSLPESATELHIVSGLHPDQPFDYYLEVIDTLHRRYPGIHLKAFTAVEINYFAEISGLSIREVLLKLKHAGLGSMPGGGAEVFSPRIRGMLCPGKATGERWLEIMETAHDLGIRTNATMLFGHLETNEERIDHLISLRDLQDKTGGFQSFVPLAFHPENTSLSEIKPVSAYEKLKMIAVSRLMLDNFDHIKAYWVMLGVSLAQIALEFGADDLDGTVVKEKITHAAGAKTKEGISMDELLELIFSAGYLPVERDTLYHELKIFRKRDCQCCPE